MKLKGFCIVKKRINRLNRHPMEWEKVFANHEFDKGLISKIYKKLYNSVLKNKQTKT
jgi:hypothetical protein